MYINVNLQIIFDHTHFLPLNASRFSSATNLKRIRLSSPVGTTTWSGRNFDAERCLTNASPFQELGHLQPRIIEVKMFRRYLYMRFASRFEIRVSSYTLFRMANPDADHPSLTSRSLKIPTQKLSCDIQLRNVFGASRRVRHEHFENVGGMSSGNRAILIISLVLALAVFYGSMGYFRRLVSSRRDIRPLNSTRRKKVA